MSNYVVAVFFILFAIMNLVETKIPNWVLGVAALAAAVAMVVAGAPWRKS